MSKSHLNRIRALEKQLNPARTHVFVLEEGKELSAEQRARVKPQDRVVIRMVPVGMLS